MKKNRGKFVSLLINAYLCNRFWDESQSVSMIDTSLETSCFHKIFRRVGLSTTKDIKKKRNIDRVSIKNVGDFFL